MDLWKIILIIILIIIIIIGITNIYFKTDILYDSILDCNLHNKVITDLKKESSANMTFSMWYFINDFTSTNANSSFLTFYNTNATIENETAINDTIADNFNDNYSATSITKNLGTSSEQQDGGVVTNTANHEGFPTIHVCLNNHRNDIHIYVRTSKASDDANIISRFVLKNVPLQKWVNLTITVDNNVFDVYLDGKLHNSFILPDALYTVNHNMDDNRLHLNGNGDNNHNTFLTRIRYIDSAVTTTEAYDIYKDGISSKHSTSLFNKYNLKVSFLEYNQEKSSFLI
tara:strand:+ start:16225 stop:17082 length:858 start_codon:yes stop_codon:yes gene_type:complete